MKLLIKQIISLKLWNKLDIQFANMLANCIFPSDTYCNKQHIKKSALILASACLSASVRTGHSCLPLNLLTSKKLFTKQHSKLTQEIMQKTGNLSIDDWQEFLYSLSVVGNGSKNTPLVLENQRLYLHRIWKDECTVAKFIINPIKIMENLQKEKIINILSQLFYQTSSYQQNWRQQIAVTISMIHPTVFISGGPGTGKTSIVTKIVTALLLYNNNLNIKMLTPTGKAAAILTESCNLKKNPQIMKSLATNDCIFDLQATTLHNFLSYRLYKQSCEYNESDILENVDYLIIDEASMIGVSILSKLISLLPFSIKIIFLGDHNQLCSVEPGSVFRDICQFSNFSYSPKRQQELIEYINYKSTDANNKKAYHHITDGICVLEKNYRFSENSGISQLANSIKSGNYISAISILNSETYTDLSYILLNEKKIYISMIINCALQYYNYLAMLKNSKISFIENILQTFNNYRILCALKDGPFGVIKLNYYIEQILHNKKLITLHNSGNYIGKPIMVLQNKPEINLYNGDVGILLSNTKNKLNAYFFSSNKIRVIPIYQLPKHETCFAMTIHKSQGSEFQHISIILPTTYLPILTRELLYTAITRASQTLTLYATDDIIIDSINHITHRYSGLYEKIKNYTK